MLASPAMFYATAILAGLGGILTIVGSYAAFGELCNRSPRKAAVLGLLLLAASVPLVALGMMERGPAMLASWQVLYATWIVAIVGISAVVLSLFGDLARTTLLAAARQAGLADELHWQEQEADSGELSREAITTQKASEGGGGVATLTKPSVSEIRERLAASRPKLDVRGLSMQATASRIKPLSNFIYRAMQVGVLLCAAGTILGGVWADYSWGRFWGWDPKEVWALITLLVYLVPLHGRFAGWVNTFGLVVASVACFLSVLMAWYGVNFVLGVGLHSYGFVEGGGQGIVIACSMAVLAVVGAAGWRRWLSSQADTPSAA
jgi:ABC-type transport system involved in cytochrome c biogenesis permease subunit